jgi:hypothetical protein
MAPLPPNPPSAVPIPKVSWGVITAAVAILICGALRRYVGWDATPEEVGAIATILGGVGGYLTPMRGFTKLSAL